MLMFNVELAARVAASDIGSFLYYVAARWPL
jgi:hypothetical protein